MTKSELIDAMAARSDLTKARAELVVNCIFDAMTEAPQRGEGIEIPGFGSFAVRPYKPYSGRNPRTGAPVPVPAKRLPFFKVGKELKELVNNSRHLPLTGAEGTARGRPAASAGRSGCMPSFPPAPEQMALPTRGVVDLHVRAELEERLTKS